MSEDKKTLIREKLAQTRQELLSLLDNIAEDQWQTAVYHGDEAGWTILDLLRHTVNAEKGMTGLMKKIKRTGEGVPPDFDRERWNASVVKKTQEKSPADLIVDMSANREALHSFINDITDEDWEKNGRHASLRILSIEEICHLIADHEASHIEDIRKALG